MQQPHERRHLLDRHSAQCVAMSKRSRTRCRRAPIPGGTVCKMHGGGAPQVKAAAAKRLDELRPLAIRRLEWLMQQSDHPSVMYQAVKDVLDRVDGRAVEHVEMRAQWSLDPAVLARLSTEALEAALAHAERVQALLTGASPR